MTAAADPVVASRDRRRPLLLATAVVLIASSLAGVGTASQVAQADEIVRFDGAGAAPHISLVGDSTLTGVRWYADYGPLRQFNFVLSAESCRRTVEQSCVSREGYRSANVLAALQTLDGELGTVLVVMSGYNDPLQTIDDAIDGVVDEARRQGVEHVVWLTLRASSDVDYSDPQEQTSINTFREYNDQLVEAAASSEGYLQVADWATYSSGASAWFESDGVHLTPRGVDAVTSFIGGTVQRVLAGEDVSPAAAPWTVLVPGAAGDTVAEVQAAMLDAGIDVAGGADGIYGNDTMAAVAEYQRRDGDLQVTGAVDLATARALGVYEDAGDDVSLAEAPAAEAPAAEERGGSAGTATPVADDSGGSGAVPNWVLVIALLAAVLLLVVIGRRRYVVARRRARRRARVHPAASPHRSVADLRRAGVAPERTGIDTDLDADLDAGATRGATVGPPR